MAKLCPRGKAAAKRKFKVYPSAYANMYASGVCSGKITPGGKKRKKAMGGGMMRPMYGSGGKLQKDVARVMSNRRKKQNILMAKKGLREWVKERWVDIGAPKKDGMVSTVRKIEKGAKESIQNACHLQKPHG